MEMTENTYYKTRKGETVQVIWIDDMDILYPVDVRGEFGDLYTVTIDGYLGAEIGHKDGQEFVNNNINDDDLVEELSKAEFPELYL